MSVGTIIVLAFLAFIGVTIFKGVRIVPQGYKWIVQRLGKYHTTLSPGLNFVIPYVDEVAYKITTKDIVLDIPSQEVITRDNAVLLMNAVAYINLTTPEKAVYGIENYTWAIQNLVQTSLRSIVGEMDLDDALSSRDHIKAKLKAAISDDISDWGITLKTVEIQDIQPSHTMQAAMEAQAAAERDRRRRLRPGFLALLGGQGRAPGGCGSDRRRGLRAHPPHQPDRHGRAAAAVPAGRVPRVLGLGWYGDLRHRGHLRLQRWLHPEDRPRNCYQGIRRRRGV